MPETHSYAWLGWTAAGVGGAIAIALATLAVVKRQRGPSPAAWALAAIADLEQLPIANSADAEAAYNEVVDVIREFFELEFNMPTLVADDARISHRSDESRSAWNRLSRDRLASLASIADEIKFARLGVGEPQVRQALGAGQGVCRRVRSAPPRR